jgi:hypothetical protein
MGWEQARVGSPLFPLLSQWAPSLQRREEGRASFLSSLLWREGAILTLLGPQAWEERLLQPLRLDGFQRKHDPITNTADVFKHLVIPCAHDLVALGFKICGSASVVSQRL